jgi:uncharacterized membrane protein
MDFVPIVVLILGVPIALAVWLIVRALRADNRIEELFQRIYALETELSRLKREKGPSKTAEAAPLSKVPTDVAPIPSAPPIPAAPRPEISTPRPPVATTSPVFIPPIPPRPIPALPPKTTPAINWEQFMGVKLFAWLGGLALFLGVAFFIKYSFDNNLVSPELRVALGFITGLGLLIGGVVMSRKNYSALSQTLCATGVVILYAITFACYAVYHFAAFGPVTTFLLMALITTTAFFLAVRLNALVVAILGMLGGFLTPILLSTGQDNPLGLFGYIAILDAGLIIIALHRRWNFLTALAAIGTVILQIGWVDKFFVAGNYFADDKIFIALGVLLGFTALFLAGVFWARRSKQLNWWLAGALLGVATASLIFTAWFLTFAPLAQRPWLMFGFVFLIDLAIAALAWLDDEAANAQPVFGLAVFGLLTEWTVNSLTSGMLNAALVFYLVFAVFHSIFPVLLQRRSSATKPLWGSRVFPSLSLALVLLPIFQLTDVSFVVWPFVLLVDVLAIALAVATLSLWPVLIMLVLTLAALGELIGKIPADLTGLPESFFLLGAFAVLFVGVGAWLARKFKPDILTNGIKLTDDFTAPANVAAQLPSFATILPFLLLIMATQRLPLANPSPVFALALLLVLLLLGVTRFFSLDWLPAVGLVCVAALECEWHFSHFNAANSAPPLVWYLIFLGVFALFPFLFRKKFNDTTVPWATAALAGVPQFFLIHRLVATAWPNDVMGLLPAAFAIPLLASLAMVTKKIPASSKARLAQLTWFGGVALFFITLIFPLQFHRQWITVGWALEGAALLWLFHRVPHPGLRLTGIGLLIAAFIRLALNPAVLAYHPRSETPVFNWYLYTYGIVTVCLFAGAKLLAPPRHQVLGSNTPPVLAGLGVVLAFLLLNIEIADFFSPPGSTLTFEFGGNFAREMTYTIAWALFAFVLLVAGIWKKIPAARYAAMGLLCVTLVKLFFHDLAQLNQLYRIGAFVGVAIIAMLASFAYQKFFAASSPQPESQKTPPA